MTVALTAVVVVLAGLSSWAGWLRWRRFRARRRRPKPTFDPWGDAMRRFGLTPDEALQVESAVDWGRRLEDVRLRRAAVAWAQQRIDRAPGIELTSRRAGWALWVVTLSAGAGGLAWVTAHRGSFPWELLILYLTSSVVVRRTSSGPRRALRLNSERAPDDGQETATTRDEDTAS
ncbi:hypothetical protein [Blastococcus sp. LR1]|uniref:hypothetical protein n=1 Tax=Blastococcus sp. LR1 TaxID=2877000 RepID=UPI001CCDDD06|nr:hypothetical protein [Blastococcus sp. LR1]MCA0146247.1 hypothetical protein [Blastococcus sp. LR1]